MLPSGGDQSPLVQVKASFSAHRGVTIGAGVLLALLVVFGVPLAFMHLQSKDTAPQMHFRASTAHKQLDKKSEAKPQVVEPESPHVSAEALRQEREQRRIARQQKEEEERRARQEKLVQMALERAAAKRAAFHAKEAREEAAAKKSSALAKLKKEQSAHTKGNHSANRSDGLPGDAEWGHVPDTRNLQRGGDVDLEDAAVKSGAAGAVDEEIRKQDTKQAKLDESEKQLLANSTSTRNGSGKASHAQVKHNVTTQNASAANVSGGSANTSSGNHSNASAQKPKEHEHLKQFAKPCNPHLPGDCKPKAHKPKKDAEEKKSNQLDDHKAPEQCHTATVGEPCFKEVVWAMTEGVAQHPNWYKPHLTDKSTFAEFQDWLHTKALGKCSKPCGEPCLCLFDVDRTLTADQKNLKMCPGAAEVSGVNDTAYSGGTLILSELAQHIPDTFCSRCYRGVVSAGDAGGSFSDLRGILMQMLGGHDATLGGRWSNVNLVNSLLVWGVSDGKKQGAVRDILSWVKQKHSLGIQDSEVYFFDDSKLNVPPFVATGYNARQVSCDTRAKGEVIGMCGATRKEVVPYKGVKMCQTTKTMQVKQ